MYYETGFPFDDGRSEEDRDIEYLRQHPDHEKALWRDWVIEVCKRRKVPTPSGIEWVTLVGQWHHNKMPITSVDELEAMRKATPMFKPKD
jgi:hypothetical protein